jgi:hypothetical protein
MSFCSKAVASRSILQTEAIYVVAVWPDLTKNNLLANESAQNEKCSSGPSENWAGKLIAWCDNLIWVTSATFSSFSLLQVPTLWSQFSAIFDNFRLKSWRFSRKTMSWSKFCTIYLCFESKTPIFSLNFSAKIFKKSQYRSRTSMFYLDFYGWQQQEKSNQHVFADRDENCIFSESVFFNRVNIYLLVEVGRAWVFRARVGLGLHTLESVFLAWKIHWINWLE